MDTEDYELRALKRALVMSTEVSASVLLDTEDSKLTTIYELWKIMQNLKLKLDIRSAAQSASGGASKGR